MSWMKRPQGGTQPPPGPDPQGYGAPQAYGTQQNMYGNYQGSTPGNAQQQQQFWQMPPQQQQPPPHAQQQQYNQQYGQVYQQEYPTNANQYYQQPAQYNQGYNQTYSQQPGVQPAYQQNFYQNQGTQPNFPQNKTNTDGWEDNWDWGWEDSKGQKGQGPNSGPLTAPQPSHPQPQVFNNANVIEESFAATDSWNWAMEDKKELNNTHHPSASVAANSQAATLAVESTPNDNNTDNEVHVHSQRSASSNSTHQPAEEIKTLNDRDVVKERLPNLALGKRFHLENLTPQWSIESQMSQESSDGPQTHSEGTYRSENQSRNSSKSSPGLNTESSNFNYSQSGMEELYPQQNIELSKKSNEESTLVNQVPSNDSRWESHDEISNSLQEMSISNSENPAPDSSLANKEVESRNLQENVGALQPPPSMSPADFPPPAAQPSNQPLAASSSAHVVGAGSQAPGLLPPPSSSSLSLPPPSSFPPTMLSQNPFKNPGPFSHKTLSKVPSASPSPIQPFPPQPNLTSPGVVNKVSQHNRVPVGFGANLETTPDNSERPDQPQVTQFRPMPVAPQVPDNLEVAPRTDRNEYLQTAHLSSGDYGENTDFSRNAPPPGLRRMVVGQQESEYSQNISLTSDEPPPGLARMVPGQQTESESAYNQPNDNYMDRHIDGGPIDGAGRPYRQAEGQQTADSYTQPPPSRGSERRPIGLDRMVPGEPSNDDYSQYQGAPYAGSNEQRVVTGLDHEFSMGADGPGPSEIREQNMDGSDYTEQTVRNPSRSVIGARESSNDVSPDYGTRPEEQQREVVMEGENLQDLSAISSAELSFSREPPFDASTVENLDRKADAPESLEHSTSGSRRQSLNHVNTSGDDSERDRLVKASPRKEKHKPSRERDRERDKEGRYSRGERKYSRDERERRARDERDASPDARRERDASPGARRTRRATRERDESPDTHARRLRRSTRSHRYETEDTDGYSDRDRYQRRQREGSYTSKPPRHDGERRYRDDRDRDRDRRYPSERHRDRDRYEQRYRDIDPTRKYGNLRKERDDERKRVVTFSSDAKSSDSSRKEGEYSPSRAESREPTATDDERDPRRRDRDRRSRHKRDPYYDVYASGGAGAYAGDPYLLQRQQYEYYERLRAADPAAYMQLYKMYGQQDYAHAYADGYVGAGYDAAGVPLGTRDERGSVHSGRSSATGLKGNDTDLNTDASLNLQLEESTVRSERMTPFRYSTAHIKGSISSQQLVVVAAAYPVDGRPARVTLAPLAAALAHTPAARALHAYPGPLVTGVTHKKSVIEYCEARARGGAGGRDPVGHALVWALLALLLRQNGVVVGTDIAELLMKNTREYEYKSADKSPRPDSRRESSASGAREDEPPDAPAPGVLLPTELPRPESAPHSATAAAAVDKLREYLTYGNRQEALEFAMNNELWGHALLLSWYGERRTRAAVAARFVASLGSRDPLHTLYAGLAAKQPPVATCVSDESWGDWRPHAAIILSNTSAKPEQDRRTLIQLGDTLSARGLIYSAQFCYISGGVQWAAHPLAPLSPAPAGPPAAPAGPPAAPPGPPAGPPRLTLLLADPRARTFAQHATDDAIFATEIYEYALSLHQDYVIKELQVYKLVLATRLVDVGLHERALAYAEQAARAVTRAPRDYAPPLVRALAALADRLRYHDPALAEDPPLAEEGADSDASPRHQQWLDDVAGVAHALAAEASAQNSPQHAAHAQLANDYYAQQYAWNEQAQQQYQPPPASFPEPSEEPQYAQYYQEQPPAPPAAPAPQDPAPPAYGYNYEENSYWQPQEYSYAEAAEAQEAGARPMITMPGAGAGAGLPGAYDDERPPSQDTDRETDTPKPSKGESKSKEERAEAKRGSGWLGGILTRLSLRPPNQMILPDDKNPTIVWDAEHKRWRDRDADADADQRAAPPPPPRADLAPHAQHQAAAAAPPAAGAPPPAAGAPPPAAPTSNIFKMQKGRHIKKSYVDVFNPSGAATRPMPPAADVLGPAAPPAPPANYFVPQPVHQSGAYEAADDGGFRSGI